MEILKPSSKALSDKHLKRKIFAMFAPNKDVIALTYGTMQTFVLVPGMKLTFVIDLGRLYFYLVGKDEEGFVISKGNHGGGLICSKLLIRTIESRLPQVKRNGPRFEVRISNTRINDCATFEILIDNNLNKQTT